MPGEARRRGSSAGIPHHPFFSPQKPRVQAAAQQIATWAAQGNNSDLLAGVKIGWEAGIGYNAYYYPHGNAIYQQYPTTSSHDPTNGLNETAGIAAGLVQLGYAAAASSGWHSGGPPLTRWDIGNLTNMYLANLTALAVRAGVPSTKVRESMIRVGGI